MAPGCVAAAFSHWRDTRILLEGIRGRVAFPLFTEGDQEARGKEPPAPGRAGNKGKSG